jgi:hypothetical protein
VNARFPLGQLVATPGALKVMESSGQDPRQLLHRHVQGDWGDMDKHDTALNEQACTEQIRIMSSYMLADGTTIWVITEGDRSSTCLLLPDEY